MEDASLIKQPTDQHKEAQNEQSARTTAVSPRPKKAGGKTKATRKKKQLAGTDKHAAPAAFGDAVVAAEHALQAIHDLATRAGSRVSARVDGAMPAVYAAIASLRANGSSEAFLAARKVKVHSNVRNLVSPLLRALAKKKHPHLRSWLAKYAAMLALAQYYEIPAAKFVEWRKDWPLEVAASKWREIQAAGNGDEQTAAMLDIPDGPALRRLQAAWDGASAGDRDRFLARNGLMRAIVSHGVV